MSAPAEEPTPPRLVRSPPSVSFGVNQHEFKIWKRLQGAGLGAILLAIGGLLAWNLDALKDLTISTANAQATATAAKEQSGSTERRVEAFDAGARAATERLERKIDANNEQTEKKLEAMKQTMDLVLREVRKR